MARVNCRVLVLLTLGASVLSGCKVERAGVKSRITDQAGNEYGDVALTILSFASRQTLSSWEIDNRLACGDYPYPYPSRLDDLVYELIPEAAYNTGGKIYLGDMATCRYQPAGPGNIEREKRLFSDKALAIKVKYPPGHSHEPPPGIHFRHGAGISVSPDKFNSLFIGKCNDFAEANGLRFCKTTDTLDGRVIWVAIVAPLNTPASGHQGVNVIDVSQQQFVKGAVVSQQAVKGAVVSQQAVKGAVVSQQAVKGGKGQVVGQHVGQFASSLTIRGRIDMDIRLPYASGVVNIAVNVPYFNHEIMGHLRDPSNNGMFVDSPDDHRHYHDEGEKLDRNLISVIMSRPLEDPKGAKDARLLRLTIKTTPITPRKGMFSGLAKVGGGVVGIGVGIAGMVSGWSSGWGVALVGGGAASLGWGVKDLSKWWTIRSDRGDYMDFMVPVHENEGDCPAMFATNITFEKNDLYMTIKSERKQSLVWDWWRNLDEIGVVSIDSVMTNGWNIVQNGGFTVFYCRKEHENDCKYPPEDMFSDSLRKRIASCTKVTDRDAMGIFGQH